VKISAVIPTYNRRAEVANAIESVLSQTMPVYEILVIDDGSIDGTAEFINNRYGGSVRLLTQKNAGVSAARNLGIREARGEWIAFLDSDDIWFPRKIERQVNALNSFAGKSGACFTDNDFGGDPELKLSIFKAARFVGSQEIGMLPEPARYMVAKLEPFYTSSFVIQRSLLEELGGFSEKMFVSEDTELFFRLSFRTQFCYVDEVLARVDRTPTREVGLCDLQHAMRDDRVFDSWERLYSQWLAMPEVSESGYAGPIRELLREVYFNSIECKLRQLRLGLAIREMARLRSIEHGYATILGTLLRRKIDKMRYRDMRRGMNAEAAVEER
jgi:glycosyltransferase involved in cell wall biosynthesis